MSSSSLLLRLLLLQSLALLSAAQGYDFFYFVQQWPGSYCDTSQGCCYPTTGQPPSDFGIHGLWPNNNDGTYPSNCDPSNPFDPSLISDLLTQLQNAWPSLSCPSSDDTSFWTHEWDKHGTCSESVLNEHAYFNAALTLKTQSNLLQALAQAGIQPNGNSYSLSSVTSAIQSAVGHLPYIQCNKDSYGDEQLFEVYLCVDHSGTQFIDCPIFPTEGPCPSSISFPSF